MYVYVYVYTYVHTHYSKLYDSFFTRTVSICVILFFAYLINKSSFEGKKKTRIEIIICFLLKKSNLYIFGVESAQQDP